MTRKTPAMSSARRVASATAKQRLTTDEAVRLESLEALTQRQGAKIAELEARLADAEKEHQATALKAADVALQPLRDQIDQVSSEVTRELIRSTVQAQVKRIMREELSHAAAR